MLYDSIVSLVERKIDLEKFLELVETNNELKELLQSKNVMFIQEKWLTELKEEMSIEEIEASSHLYEPNESLYDFLHSEIKRGLGGEYNISGVLKSFLQLYDIPFEKNDELKNLYNLMLDVQPTWVDLPNEYMTKLLENAGDLKGVELKKHLKATILEEFRFVKSKPRWLQSPDWVFIDGKPLLFVGQLDITGIWHDTARLYVFYDEAAEKYHTVEQFM